MHDSSSSIISKKMDYNKIKDKSKGELELEKCKFICGQGMQK